MIAAAAASSSVLAAADETKARADYLTDPVLAMVPGVRHGFFTRRGGVSDPKGIYGGLNCGFGSDDSAERVRRNRALAMEAFDQPPEALVTAYQVHSPDVATVTEPWAPDQAPKLDALVTDRPGIALGILTADCAPVLFLDPAARDGHGIIGAAHAGWKGALGGIVEATLEAMEALGAKRERVLAAIGPAIRQASYEVGSEFRDRFLDADPDYARFFQSSERTGHFQFDLPGFIGVRLATLGVARAAALGHDTCDDPALFYSYRRARLRSEPDYGRLLSAICLTR